MRSTFIGFISGEREPARWQRPTTQPNPRPAFTSHRPSPVPFTSAQAYFNSRLASAREAFESRRQSVGVLQPLLSRRPLTTVRPRSLSAGEDAPTKTSPRALVADNYHQVLRTARATARRYGLPRSLDEDLETVGLRVLERTAKTFNPAQGVKYSTFLLASLLPDLRKAAAKLKLHRGHVTDDEIEGLADELDLSEDVEDSDLRETLESLVHQLPAKERDVVMRHTGLDGGDRDTLQALGEKMGVPSATVRTIYSRALGRLRSRLEERGLDAEAMLSGVEWAWVK